jgi:aspartyl-tRNA(Asn)/glutamyl-tRNA(Gln) amidotransferase subunit B
MTQSDFYMGAMGPWEIVIGVEVHAQIVSNAKLFSPAATQFGAEPNTQVSFIDAAMPGMLPTLNKFCVEQAIKTGLGLNAIIHLKSIFDRKNYFYADLPAGYQISQFQHPIVGNGYIDIDKSDGSTKRIGVTRLHLEQDAGKSFHDQSPTRSFIDLNRAGVALMEIVSEPDMRSAEEVMAYIRKLRTILRYLGTCDGNMEEGSMRADVNVSVRKPGGPLGTRAEIKNVNSVRFIGQAIAFEVSRQVDLLESGQCVIQETRLYDASKGETRSMRSKEDAQDYRYFPDPDLPPLVILQDQVERIRSQMPELPDAKKHRLVESLGLPSYDAGVIVSERETANYFEEVLACIPTFKNAQKDNKVDAIHSAAKLAANWLTGDFFAALNRSNLEISQSPISPSYLAELVELIATDVISGRIAKDVFIEMWDTKQTAKTIVESKGLQQITDMGAVEAAIDNALNEHQDKVAEYRSGKDKLFGFFVGQVMKVTGGKANPALVNELLLKKLNS